MKSLIKQGTKRKMHPNSLANLEKGKFQKGQVANPNGRPPKDYSITSIIKSMLDLPVDAALPGADGKTWRQLIARAILYGSAKGNPTMIKELLDRLEGKVTQPIGGDTDSPPIKTEIIVVNDNAKRLTEEIINGEGTN